MTRSDERGSALVAAVAVLSAMTLLATISLMAGSADLVLSTRLARERSAFYAVESALETSMRELVSGAGVVPEASFHPPWPEPGIAMTRWQDGDWACSRRVCLIPDVRDADGDPGTTVVLYDRSFGYSSSPLARGGSPVVQLLVAVEGAGARKSAVAEVAAVTCAPAIGAAWTAAGPLALAGDLRVVGSEALPAVIGRLPVRLLEGSVVDGEQILDPLLRLPADVLRILNPGGTMSRLDELPEPPAGGALAGLNWARGDYAGPLDGSGILVVHNPSFDPVKHEASRVALEDGVFGEEYDATYSHLDPSRQPARLVPALGGAFDGVIVADAVGGATARFTLNGALVTLTRSPLAVTAVLPVRVVGSAAAIERSGRGALRHQVGFRTVPANAAWLDGCP